MPSVIVLVGFANLTAVPIANECAKKLTKKGVRHAVAEAGTAKGSKGQELALRGRIVQEAIWREVGGVREHGGIAVGFR